MPPKKKAEKMVRQLMYLDAELKERLDRHSEQTMAPAAAIVRRALEEYLDRVEKLKR